MAVKKANYFLFCENLLKDDRNRISLVNIFDIIGGESLPIVPSKFVVAFNVTLTRKDITDRSVNLKLLITGPNNKEVLKLEGKGKMEVDEGNIASSIDLSGKIPFRETGSHVAKLFINGDEVSSNKFEVIVGKPEDVIA